MKSIVILIFFDRLIRIISSDVFISVPIIMETGKLNLEATTEEILPHDDECDTQKITENNGARVKRNLIFTNQTLFQINVGVAVPVPLKYRTVNVNLIYQANLMCPWNLTQIPPYSLLGPSVDTARKKRDKESNSQRNDENNSGFFISKTEQPEVHMDQFYKYVEELMNSYGQNGSQCVLRSICQWAAHPLYSDSLDDVFYDILHFLLSPKEPESPQDLINMRPYISARQVGAVGGEEACARAFSSCSHSPLDIITELRPHG